MVRVTILVTLFWGLFGASMAHAQKVDLNVNGMSDIWELIFGAANLDPNADNDADGVPNRMESIAATNPFDSNSVPKISFVSKTSTNFSVTIPAALGKQYQLQSVATIAGILGTNWVTESSIIARTGTVVTLSAPPSGSTKFFRIAIADVDTDGDGVNDWEEYQLGLDPFNPTSNGQLDSNGHLMTDYAFVTSRLASQNMITISATDPTTTQPDPGQAATDLGMVTITRGGFPLNSITVNLALGGPGSGFAIEGVDHAVLPRLVSFPAGSSSQTVLVRPLADTNLMSPVIAMLKVVSGATYSVGSSSNASVVIYPSPTPNGTGITGQYFRNSNTNYSSSVNFNPTNLVLTRMDSAIDFVWGTTSLPITNTGTYTVRWTGQIEPQYSETYTFDANTDDGVKLYVNDQLIIDRWVTQGATDSLGTIALQAGVHYNIRMDYFNNGGSAVAHLSWYSPSQSKQIIPSTRLFPTTVASAPTAVISPLTAVAFLGQPFSFSVVGANSASNFTAVPLPPGLGLTNGIISGIPTLAGDYQVSLTASNANGLGASVVDVQVIDTGSSITREVWSGVPGINVIDIPVGSPATTTNSLGTLEGITDYADNYGERIRGYLTAPVTGNYYFWIAASDSAELWISNDEEPANKVRRAYVLPSANPVPPPANGTAPRQWNLQPNQKSPWLALVAGQQYYVEILHKAGAGTNDNFAVAWLQDPTGTNNTPTGIVPGYVLSRYFNPAPSSVPGTLYAADMLAPSGVASSAVGSATLRLSADETKATLTFSYSGLSSAPARPTSELIWNDPYLDKASQVIYDFDVNTPQPDGSYVWTIKPIGTLSAADIVEIIKEGKAYVNFTTPTYTAGEIAGHYSLANGTQTFTPPPAPPTWTDDHSTQNGAARFLLQSTFGPSPNDIATVQSLGYDAWITDQFSKSVTYHLPNVLANPSADPTDPYPSSLTFNTWWQRSITAPDQLRQRVAFALSEIMVISENGVLQDNARAMSSYYDTLLDNSFGNFRSLLKAVTLSPAMGLYLDMRGNDKGSLPLGTHANENYAREIQQLFSIGLYRMWPDGTLVMDSHSNLVPTYNQNVIMGFAAVFTGWNYYQTNQANGHLPSNFFPGGNYTNPMVLVPTHHDLGTKLLLDNVVLPAAAGGQLVTTNSSFDDYGLQDLDLAMDSLFNNQNVGPFICRQLIQRLVTSSPSRDYLYRVVQKFNDNGSGVRGDMQAVIRAILMDYEARSSVAGSQPTFGKQREPLLRATAPARAFMAPPSVSGTYSENGDRPITVVTSSPHRAVNNDTVYLNFTDTSGKPAPSTQAYGVTVINSNTFTVNSPGLSAATYAQTNSTITVTLANHGLAVGNPAYLVFTTGGGSNGLFQVVTVPTTGTFTAAAVDSATRAGNCLLPKLSASGYTQTTTNINVSISGNHGLAPSDSVYINFTSGTAVSGQYQVASVPDSTHFIVTSTNSASQNQNSLTVYSLVAPPLTRAGTVVMQESTWNVSYSDSDLTQTPLRSPTVFNFFFPDYKFQGPLAAAGLTTPEFQLTSDTSVGLQMNFLQAGFLSTGNTNGVTSWRNNGSIVMDLGPWMTTNYTANAGVPNMVDGLNTLLTGGQLATNARTTIINYVANTTNFPYSTSPSQSQMRDRARAVVHLLITSPDYTIQK
ncbi:MAG: hypothetical protein JWR26_4757 [Pedosphaera sp.]|nr:hypothetical protein [Pedosphaera sp.]